MWVTMIIDPNSVFDICEKQKGSKYYIDKCKKDLFNYLEMDEFDQNIIIATLKSDRNFKILI